MGACGWLHDGDAARSAASMAPAVHLDLAVEQSGAGLGDRPAHRGCHCSIFDQLKFAPKIGVKHVAAYVRTIAFTDRMIADGEPVTMITFTVVPDMFFAFDHDEPVMPDADDLRSSVIIEEFEVLAQCAVRIWNRSMFSIKLHPPAVFSICSPSSEHLHCLVCPRYIMCVCVSRSRTGTSTSTRASN